jgi:hypothetical protein
MVRNRWKRNRERGEILRSRWKDRRIERVIKNYSKVKINEMKGRKRERGEKETGKDREEE